MLASLAELKAYLGVESAAQDAALSAALDYAHGYVSGATGRSLETADYAEIHAARNGKIFLHQWPVVSVESVHVDPEGNFPPESMLPAAAWRLLPGGILSRVDGQTFPETPGSVRAAYRAGFKEGAVPGDLRMACVMLAAHVFRQRRGLGVESRSLGQGSLHHRHGVPEEVERVILFYRRKLA
jgi:uncharacterized phiE125 gp8 family phage protein